MTETPSPDNDDAAEADRLTEGVSPASNDLVCWLWAAFPPKDGKLHVARIAAGLGVSTTTVRRWIRDAGEDQQTTNVRYPPLTPAGMKIVRRRAILRGRGHYLWPPLDQGSRDRSIAAMSTARVARRNLLEFGPTPRDRDTQRDQPHDVHLVHYRAARVYGVATTINPKSLAKIRQYSEIIHTLEMPDKWAATILREAVLEHYSEHRCIAPRQLVPTGRTATWHESAGAPTRQTLEQLAASV